MTIVENKYRSYSLLGVEWGSFLVVLSRYSHSQARMQAQLWGEDEPLEIYVAASKPNALARVTAAHRLFSLSLR
jgi:hypothetical protein